MEREVAYGTSPRKLSRAGIASLGIGLFTFSYFLYVVIFGLPSNASNTARWMMLAPAYLAELIAIVLCVVSIVGQRRYWWAALPALVLNGLPLGVVVLLFISRYW